MAEKRIAFIFPAFINDYRDDPSGSIPQFGTVFNTFLARADGFADKGLAEFQRESNPMISDELRNQYLSYVYSCSCSEVLAGNGVEPSMIAGYSMGIYASLYTAGSISFETGLLFIRKAYESIRETLPGNNYGMGAVIGLGEKDIHEIFQDLNLNLLIVNRNSDHSFIVSGDGLHLNVFLSKAKEEGALSAKSLGVSVPYHTGLLKAAAAELSLTVEGADLRDPKIPLISLLSRQLITDAKSAGNEVVRNLFNPLDWRSTQTEMYRMGEAIFTECGPSRALMKNSKFIPGAGKFVVWSSLAGKLDCGELRDPGPKE